MFKKSINKKVVFVLTLILLGTSVVLIQAQEKKSIKDKLEEIKGEAKSITIETSEGKYNFKGDEARDLMKIIKQKRMFEFEKQISMFPDSDDTDIFVLHRGNMPKPNMFWFQSDLEDDGNKEIKVEKNDGKTTVTVITKVDGKEETKVLTGDEAEKYLEKENKLIKIKKHEKPIMLGNGCCCCKPQRFNWDNLDDEFPPEDVFEKREFKKVTVNEDDGVKIVVVETTENGRKKVETFKGKEAEEYLKKMEDDDKMKINDETKGQKKIKKIIINK